MSTIQPKSLAWEIKSKKDSISQHELVKEVRVIFSGSEIDPSKTGLVVHQGTGEQFVPATQLATPAWNFTYNIITGRNTWY